MGLGLGLGLGLDNKFRMPTTSICCPVQKDVESGTRNPPGPSRDIAHMRIQKFYGEKMIGMMMVDKYVRPFLTDYELMNKFSHGKNPLFMCLFQVAGNQMFPLNFISSIHQAVL